MWLNGHFVSVDMVLSFGCAILGMAY